MDDPREKEARKLFEDLPEDVRTVFRDAARSALAAEAEEQGIPAEDVIPPVEVDERALALFRSWGSDQVGDALANLSEFFTKEERRKIYTEEEFRLSKQYPEGVPSMVLAQAVIERMQRERPEWYG